MFRSTTAAVLLTLLASVNPAQAADRDKAVADEQSVLKASFSAAALAGEVDWSMAPVKFEAPSRGSLLPSLYVSLAGLNAFDAYTTSRGVTQGAVEGNPMMKAVAGRPAVLWAVKGGVTAGSVFIAERLWKKNNKVGAIVVMVVSNGMMATVAARNAAVLRRQPTR